MASKAVATKKSAAVSAPADQEKLDMAKQAFPVEERVQFLTFPRLGMVSQDVIEGTGKRIKVVEEAGTFFTEVQDEEESEVEETVTLKNGKTKTEMVKKRLWQKSEQGDTIDAIIIFQRKQLKFFDKANDTFVSSSMYDHETDVIPLFEGKNEVARGTAAELKSGQCDGCADNSCTNKHGEGYEFKDDDGKKKCKLKDTRILYVWYLDKVYQLSIGGTSMYSYMKYSREVSPSCPGVVTRFNSEPQENGNIKWNKMTFEKVRDVTQEELDEVLNSQAVIMKSITDAKAFFAKKDADTTSDKAFKEF